MIRILWNVPGLALELSCIRSFCKMLKHRLEGGVRTCYVISVMLTVTVLAFLIPALLGVVDMNHRGVFGIYVSERLLLPEWLGFLVSFVLGSIPIKQKSKHRRR